jgi:hypothetical protein
MRLSIAAPLLSVASLLLVAANCNEDPCTDFVDYVCTCHEDDPDFDCEDIQTTLEDADPDVKDQCALDLDDLQAEDADAGEECAI